MDLKRLQHLVALADEGHFGRAAERVHLSQPALTRSVQAAEAELGLPLFNRGGTRISCTAAGQFVVERARRLLFDSRCLARDARLLREGQLGDLSLGAGPFAAATLIPPLAIELRQHFAGVNCRVEVNNWQYLLQHLRAEELDFLLAEVRDIAPAPDLLITPAGQHAGGFFVRAGHPLLQQVPLDATAILPFGLASVRLPEAIRKVLHQALRLPPGESLPLVLECDDVGLLKQVALATDTVLGGIRLAVQDELRAARLVELSPQGLPQLFNAMGIVSLRGRSHSPVAQFAVDYLLAQAAASGL